MAARAKAAARLPDELWDTKRLAGYLGIEPKTLDNWASLGTGPVFRKVGNQRRYDPADVAEWLAERRSDAGGTAA